MDTVTKRLYEALFLVDSTTAASDWQGIVDFVKNLLEKNSGEIVDLKKWDERKLAYDIKGHSRGTYILVYFNCDPLSISTIERDVQLSEQIMRVMILRTDKMSKEDIEKDTPLMAAEKRQAEAERAAAVKAAEDASDDEDDDDDYDGQDAQDDND